MHLSMIRHLSESVEPIERGGQNRQNMSFAKDRRNIECVEGNLELRPTYGCRLKVFN